jgi:hypothetical protein
MTITSHNAPPSQTGKWPFIGYACLIALALSLLGWAISLVQMDRAFDASGRKTTAICTDIDQETGKRAGESRLTYTYKVGSQTFTNQATIANTTFPQARAGSIFRVTYLPDHPDKSRLDWSLDAGIAGRLLWASGAFCVFVTIIVAGGIHKRRKGQENHLSIAVKAGAKRTK